MTRFAALLRAALVASSVGAAACSSDGSRGVPITPAATAPERPRARRAPAPADWYWEGLEPELHEPDPKPLDLPVAEANLSRPEGASRLWDELDASVRDRLRRDGLVVVPPLGDKVAARLRMGAFYTDLRERRMPTLVTVDALFATAVLGISRALAAVEASELAPATSALLVKLAARLDATAAPSPQEIVLPQRLARGVVAVAAALASGAPAPPELAPVVAQEVARINEHAGVATSPLLQVPIDYARFAVPSGASSPGAFRAATWLGSAPLLLAARTELRGGSADLTVVRAHTRAAMLLSRLVDRDLDPEVSEAYARVARLVAFVWGSPDDLSLVELGDLAEALKVDLAKPAAVASVTRVDQVRHRAALLRPPRLYDGSGGLATGKPPASVRVLGGHAAPDALALGSLLAGDLARTRPLPTVLDVAAWLGAPGIRTTLRESGMDAAPGYDDALARAVALRPGEDDAARHGSVEGSLLDVLLAWAEAKETGARSVATERARTESLLAAWTLARHAGRPFARGPAKVPARPRELDVTGATAPVYVEPAPVAIAHLLSAVRQANKGFGALAALDPKSPERVALAEIEDLLGLALRAAAHAHDDEAPSPDDVTALASFPARLAALEGDLPDADLAALAEVATDLRTRRVLVAGVAGVEPALVLVKDPARDAGAVLAVGAHLVLTERVEPLASRTSDAGWVARLRASPYEAPTAPPVASTKAPTPLPLAQPGDDRALSWMSTFRVTRGGRAAR